MRSSLARLLLVLVVILASAGAMLWLERIPVRRLASILGVTVTVSDISGPSASPDVSMPPLADRVPALSMGTVAVRTLAGAQAVRTAAGTIITSDGLVVTTAAGAPYGTGYSYRIVTSRGTTVAARRVAYDAQHALVLLDAELSDSGVVPFSDQAPRAGDPLTAVSAGISGDRYAPVIVPVAVVSAHADGQLVLSLDRTFVSALAGARLVDRAGATIGLLRAGTAIGMVPASAVNAFVARYLDTLGD